MFLGQADYVLLPTGIHKIKPIGLLGPVRVRCNSAVQIPIPIPNSEPSQKHSMMMMMMMTMMTMMMMMMMTMMTMIHHDASGDS